MHLELGVAVQTVNREKIGNVDQLVVDGNTQEVTDFILRTGHVRNHGYVVPMDTIDHIDERNVIHLRLTGEQLRVLPEFEAENFITPARSAREDWRYVIAAGQGGTVVPVLPGAVPVGSVYRFDPAGDTLFGVRAPTDEPVITWSNLPEWAYRVGKHTTVITCDGHTVGTFHEVELDENGVPTGIVVHSGIFHHTPHYLPAAQIRTANAKEIVLTIAKDAYEAMNAPFASGT